MKGRSFSDRFRFTRRGLLSSATGILTALVSLSVGIPILGSIVGPSFRKRKEGWIKVGDLAELPGGEPQRLTFAAETLDAYIQQTTLRNVWVVKQSPSSVTVYSPICPHLGCEVNWNSQSGHFECPCHGSVYAMDGKVLAGPAPRPLDSLPARIERGELHVQWQRFKIGIPRKVPV
jgi:menaquinol-cytochrome c reductase iron-sulfur subunit